MSWTGAQWSQRTPPTASVQLQFGTHQQVIDGFGGAQPQAGLTSALADLFFTTGAGCIGLTLFRMEYASNSGGPTPYFPEQSTIAGFYADAVLAAARGASVWAAPWSAMNTAWKSNGSFIEGHLLSAHYTDFANFIAGLQADLIANSGPALLALSMCNEPDIADGQVSYTSMQFTDAEMVSFIKVAGPIIAALSPRPKIVASENFNWDNAVTYLATLSADATAYGYVDIIATHQYAGTVAALNTTKKVWQTEMSGLNDTPDATITHALVMAGWIHSALTTGNVNAWHYWWLVNTNNNDNEGLIGFQGDSISAPTMTKRFYALGNWSRFVRPGMVRVSTSGAISGVNVTCFLNTSTGDFAIVAVNNNAAWVSFNFALSELIASTCTPWVTDAARNLVSGTPLSIARGLLSVSLAPSSITTFVGTGS